MVVCATVGDNKQLLHVGEGARGCPQANTYANGYKSKTVNPPLDKRNRKDMQRKKKLSSHTKNTQKENNCGKTQTAKRDRTATKRQKVPHSWMEPRKKGKNVQNT